MLVVVDANKAADGFLRVFPFFIVAGLIFGTYQAGSYLLSIGQPLWVVATAACPVAAVYLFFKKRKWLGAGVLVLTVVPLVFMIRSYEVQSVSGNHVRSEKSELWAKALEQLYGGPNSGYFRRLMPADLSNGIKDIRLSTNHGKFAYVEPKNAEVMGNGLSIGIYEIQPASFLYDYAESVRRTGEDWLLFYLVCFHNEGCKTKTVAEAQAIYGIDVEAIMRGRLKAEKATAAELETACRADAMCRSVIERTRLQSDWTTWVKPPKRTPGATRS